MIFQLAYENCSLNQVKLDFSAGCDLANLRLANRLIFGLIKKSVLLYIHSTKISPKVNDIA